MPHQYENLCTRVIPRISLQIFTRTAPALSVIVSDGGGVTAAKTDQAQFMTLSSAEQGINMHSLVCSALHGAPDVFHT